ncbi:Clavaminate synthase-like protein, partial [Artomyces pyxidatus]
MATVTIDNSIVWRQSPLLSPLLPYQEVERRATVLGCGIIDSLQHFERLWGCGEPVVVTNVSDGFQGEWTPQYFSSVHGSARVTLHDCETGTPKPSTVAEFFDLFGDPERGESIYKLKDWPPTKNFKDEFPELYNAFKEGIPFPDYTRPDGISNLMSHWPTSQVVPDLGPKLYIAFGTSQDNVHHGSTRLHCDITGAVNVSLYSTTKLTGEPGAAVWHIFHRADSDTVRQFIKSLPGYNEEGDPIHNQSTYLTPEMLLSLAQQHKVVPYTIYQRPGDAIFIPAGSPHQVSNETDTIKIACDFLSVQDLLASERLVHELRTQRLATDFGDDVLQFYTSLWYAW